MKANYIGNNLRILARKSCLSDHLHKENLYKSQDYRENLSVGRSVGPLDFARVFRWFAGFVYILTVRSVGVKFLTLLCTGLIPIAEDYVKIACTGDSSVQNRTDDSQCVHYVK